MSLKFDVSLDLIELEMLALVKGCVVLEYFLQKNTEVVIPKGSPILANVIGSGCSFETVKLLLKAGAEIKVKGCRGKTANYLLNRYGLKGEISMLKAI